MTYMKVVCGNGNFWSEEEMLIRMKFDNPIPAGIANIIATRYWNRLFMRLANEIDDL